MPTWPSRIWPWSPGVSSPERWPWSRPWPLRAVVAQVIDLILHPAHRLQQRLFAASGFWSLWCSWPRACRSWRSWWCRRWQSRCSCSRPSARCRTCTSSLGSWSCRCSRCRWWCTCPSNNLPWLPLCNDRCAKLTRQVHSVWLECLHLKERLLDLSLNIGITAWRPWKLNELMHTPVCCLSKFVLKPKSSGARGLTLDRLGEPTTAEWWLLKQLEQLGCCLNGGFANNAWENILESCAGTHHTHPCTGHTSVTKIVWHCDGSTSPEVPKI